YFFIFSFDLEKKHFHTKLTFKWITIEGQYEIDGRILVLPIKGNGPANISCDNFVLNYDFDYKLIKKDDGKEYFDPNIKPVLTYDIAKNHFYFGNLFNGDKTLEQKTNQFLNEHGFEIDKDFSIAVSDIINSITTSIVKQTLQIVSFDEIFI
ncbi:hypothetical protein NQ314_018376, partial [Rhamnusium bicolor]